MQANQHLSLDMQIGKKNLAIKHGCIPITDEDINSVPCPNTFIEKEINERICEEAKNVLRASKSSKNKYKYGEVGIAFSLNNTTLYESFLGHYHSIRLNDETLNNQKFSRIIKEYNERDLFFIHNHPNNSIISGNDILTLCSNRQFLGIVAIGNTRNMYILVKANDDTSWVGAYVIAKSQELLQKNGDLFDNIKKYRDIVACEILNNAGKFNLIFEKYNRRNVK